MSNAKKLTKLVIMAGLVKDTKARVFARVFRDAITKKGKGYVGKFRLNATTWLEAPIDTVKAGDFLASTDKAMLCEIDIKMLGAALKDQPEGAEFGGNFSKRGHLYLNGITVAEAIKLGELPAHTTKKGEPAPEVAGPVAQ